MSYRELITGLACLLHSLLRAAREVSGVGVDVLGLDLFATAEFGIAEPTGVTS